jgi:7-cyano-7-deazaguanine synthase
MVFKKKVLLLFSGGLDSMVLAERVLAAGHDLVTLFVRYPHPAVPFEYRAASEWLRLKRLAGQNIKNIELTLGISGVGAMAIGAGQAGARVVPGRNQIFVSHAVNIAATSDAQEVWYGANLDDATDYPDCSPLWVSLMNGLASQWGIILRAPLLYKTKSQIMNEAKSMGLEGWWSCYEPKDNKPCGTCNSCQGNTI